MFKTHLAFLFYLESGLNLDGVLNRYFLDAALVRIVR